ncbi:MAG: GntR family transcriptional regulator [Deltaproteobacteria bacterium]|jgi:GntR family transcriptional regulator|nr:GntR family transcriptional regulator [Deltaproteobacteria bacterium]
MYAKSPSPKIKAIDKDNAKNPAYLQLSQIIKNMIARGVFQPGAKLPSEAAIGKRYGLSTMTVRQAIRVVVEQGLLRRIQGSGTYVTTPAWTQASFTWDGLMELLTDRKNTALTIVKASIMEAGPKAAESLRLTKNGKVIHLIRLVSHRDKPFLLNEAMLKFNPQTPIVEAELELSSLSGLFTGEGSHYIKKTSLRVEPALLSAAEAAQLRASETEPAFKISYIFYDYRDRPLGLGWFLTPKKYITLSTKIGLWDQ